MKLILLSVSLLILCACSARPDVVRLESKQLQARDQSVFVVSHGWHTGFIISPQLLYQKIPMLKARFASVPYLEFGWGDKGFYQANEITTGLSLQAILWPTESVMHVVAITERPNLYFPDSHVEQICLAQDEFLSLLQFIENSFLKSRDGKIIPIKNGLYGNSQFYQGEGDYYLMNTCNKWTAKGLASAGMDISPMFKLTAASIMDFIVENDASIGNQTTDCSVEPETKVPVR